ncbi:MAG: hypothetical protein ACO3H6_02400 [Bacilli bacterium]
MVIEIFGLDKYVVASLSRELQPSILKLTQLKPSQLYFAVHETLIFHNGVDQNAWHTMVKVQLEPGQTQHQTALIQLLTKALKPHTIHVHLEFYVQPTHQSTHLIQEDYPLFVSETNQVNLDLPDEEDSKEIYHGNMFAGKERDLEKLDQSKPLPTTKKKKVA